MSFDLKTVEQKMNKCIESLNFELTKVRTGRANPAMLDGILVEAYSNMTPINQVALVNVAEARQLLIKPFDKSIIGSIEKAINNANLGVNPSSDGEVIRITIAPLTEETRKVLCKDVKANGEDAKIRLRNVRQDAMSSIKKDKDLPEDAKKASEKKVEELTKKFNVEIDNIVSKKEQDVMTI